jgi:hypothetical protein
MNCKRFARTIYSDVFDLIMKKWFHIYGNHMPHYLVVLKIAKIPGCHGAGRYCE